MRVKIDTRALEQHLKKRLPRDILVAEAEALTETAKTARKMLPLALADDFIIRTRWLLNSFRHGAATATQKPHPYAYVGTISPLLESHVDGGPRRGGKHMGKQGVPKVGLGLARARPDATTRPARWPGRAVKQKRTFAIHFTEGGDIGIYRRVGGTPSPQNLPGRAPNPTAGAPRRRKPKKSVLRLLWVLRDKVTIKPRWRFEAQVQVIVKHFFPLHLHEALLRRVWKARQG